MSESLDFVIHSQKHGYLGQIRKIGHYAALAVLVNHRRQTLAKRLIQM